MIYFAQLPTGSIKIGRSDDVPRRMKALERHYGVPLVLLRTEPGGRPEEDAWHERFAVARLGRSEQFRPIPALMAAIGRPLLVGVNPETVEVVEPARPRQTFVRMDDELVEEARKVAALRGVSVAQYFLDLCKPLVRRDLEREARKLTGGAKGGEAETRD